MKIALVYDRINKIGGAEKVLEVLHQLWPQAPLFTAVYNPSTAKWAKGWDIKTSFIQSIPFAKRHHEWFAWLTPLAFESFNFNNFDIVISVTSAEAKGIITSPRTLHICYLLTPTRYLWVQPQNYSSSLGPILNKLAHPLLSNLRSWDQLAAQRPDKIIAISQTVAKRCQKFYRRQPDAIIYPPVDVKKFKQKTTSRSLLPTPYYLIVSRLVAYKNIDAVIKAFNNWDRHLVIVGTGAQKNKLQRLAKANIHFTGQISDQKLINYYQTCQALIMPQEEDFGIVALEVQAAGKPVIAYNKGGATETVIKNQTGIFFSSLKSDIIRKAVIKYERIRFSSQKLHNHAQTFNIVKFKKQFKTFVEDQWHKHQKTI